MPPLPPDFPFWHEQLSPAEKAFLEKVAHFAETEVAPHAEAWEQPEKLPRDIFTQAGRIGLLGAGRWRWPADRDRPRPGPAGSALIFPVVRGISLACMLPVRFTVVPLPSPVIGPPFDGLSANGTRPGRRIAADPAPDAFR